MNIDEYIKPKEVARWVSTFGDAKNSNCLVLLHGTPGTQHSFGGKDLIPKLFVDKGFFVIVPTRRGYPPRNSESYTSYSDYCNELRDILDFYKVSKATIVSGSGGGPFSLAFASMFPERTKTVFCIAVIGDFEAFKNSTYLSSDTRDCIRATSLGKIEQMDYCKKNKYEKFVEGLFSDASLIFGDHNIAFDKIQSPVIFHSGLRDPHAPIESVRVIMPNIKNSKLIVYKDYIHETFSRLDFWEKFSREVVSEELAESTKAQPPI